MNKKLKNVIGMVALSCILASSALVSAGKIAFSADMPGGGVHTSIVDDRVKTADKNGSTVINPQSSNYSYVAVWADRKVGSGYSRVSEVCFAEDGIDEWLGYYTNSPSRKGDTVRLRGSTQGLIGNRFTGTWDYQ